MVAAGGMCEGGRIIQHLTKHIDDPRATIILVSYQAQRTLGRQLLEGCQAKRGGNGDRAWRDRQVRHGPPTASGVSVA